MTPRARAEALYEGLQAGDEPTLDAIERAITAATDDAYERAAIMVASVADGYHFAGLPKTEKHLREIADAIRALRSKP